MRKPSVGPSNFYSFNDPHGMCENCEGLGRVTTVDLDRLLDGSRTLNEGAITFPAFAVGTAPWQLYAESGLFDPDKTLDRFTEQERELLLYGSGFRVDRRSRHSVYKNEYEGVVTRFTRRYLKRDAHTLSDRDREAVARVVTEGSCPECGGTRLNAAARGSRIGAHNIADYAAMEIGELIGVLAALDDPVAKHVATAALAVLRRIEAVGLGYLSLDRETSTVSGGEGRRLKIVRHLGSSLIDVTYIFDEPSVGLHPRDVHRLNELLMELRDKGNTVLVVEHDRQVIAIADHVVDMGPGAGTHGGEIVFEGTTEELRFSGSSPADAWAPCPASTGHRAHPPDPSPSPGPPCTISRTSPSTSRPVSSPRSPASPVRARAAWSPTSSPPATPTRSSWTSRRSASRRARHRLPT